MRFHEVRLSDDGVNDVLHAVGGQALALVPRASSDFFVGVEGIDYSLGLHEEAALPLGSLSTQVDVGTRRISSENGSSVVNYVVAEVNTESDLRLEVWDGTYLREDASEHQERNKKFWEWVGHNANGLLLRAEVTTKFVRHLSDEVDPDFEDASSDLEIPDEIRYKSFFQPLVTSEAELAVVETGADQALVDDIGPMAVFNRRDHGIIIGVDIEEAKHQKRMDELRKQPLGK